MTERVLTTCVGREVFCHTATHYKNPGQLDAVALLVLGTRLCFQGQLQVPQALQDMFNRGPCRSSVRTRQQPDGPGDDARPCTLSRIAGTSHTKTSA